MCQRSSNRERAEQVRHQSTESLSGGGEGGLYRVQDVPAVQQ